MLESTNYRALDTFLPFILGHVDYWLGYVGLALLMTVHTTYTDLVNRLITGAFGITWMSADLEKSGESVEKFKAYVTALFRLHFPAVLGMLKHRPLHHIVDDHELFAL